MGFGNIEAGRCYLYHHLYLYSGSGLTFFKSPNIAKPYRCASFKSGFIELIPKPFIVVSRE